MACRGKVMCASGVGKGRGEQVSDQGAGGEAEGWGGRWCSTRGLTGRLRAAGGERDTEIDCGQHSGALRRVR